MTTRTAHLRAAFAPHLSIFSEGHRAQLEELLSLAELGERARNLLAELSSTHATAEPARKNGKAARGKPKAKRSSATKKPARNPRAPKKPSRGAVPKDGPSLRETIVRVLAAAGKPLAIAEIAAATRAAGHASESSDFRTLLANTLGLMKKDVRRVSRGVYASARSDAPAASS